MCRRATQNNERTLIQIACGEFLQNVPGWFKVSALLFLLVCLPLQFIVGTTVLGWLILVMLILTLAMALKESTRQTRRLMREIVAHEEIDRALQAAKESAEAASYAKTRYLSGISHEIRTPLQSILGYAQILKREDHGRDTRRAIDVIHRSGEHLSDLIEGLLDVSRIEAGRIELRSEVVRLPELLRQLNDIFEPMAEKKGVAFQMKLLDRLPNYVQTDPQRLRQILTNVLSNAVKYTSKGSVRFEVRYGSQVAEFVVTDTGYGIDPEDLDTIFRPFERGHIRDGGTAGGAGLGLTIVQLLCDVMGGEVTVQSTLGEGSEFRMALYLPRTDAPVGEDNEASLPTGYEGQPRTIMVVDDDPVQRGLILDMLGPLGFTVWEARDAQQCLDRLGEGDLPHLMLLDVSMPGLSGLELARLVREQYPGLPIIMMSANVDEPLPGTDDAYDHYLVKPIRLDVFLEQLSERMSLLWRYDSPKTDDPLSDSSDGWIEALIHSAEMGHVTGFRELLAQVIEAGWVTESTGEALYALTDELRFEEAIERLKGLEA